MSEHIILYSTNCPRCKVLKAKLDEKGIPYELCTDVKTMYSRGFLEAPVLDVNGDLMNFSQAIKFVNEYVAPEDDND